jgi:hypothetical protein
MQSVPEGLSKLLNRMVSRNKQFPWGSFRGISSLVIHLGALFDLATRTIVPLPTWDLFSLLSKFGDDYLP